MTSIRMKKALAGISAAVMFISQTGIALAAYSDVAAGVWYEDAVNAFLDAGYLDASQSRFRGGDNANRAEFVKLVVELNGGILSTPPAVPSFDDVAPGAWYYGYMEEAGKEGWVRGDGSCYGTSPCYARPAANINRAEASAIIVRSFGLEATGDAAQFVDNPSGQWYTADIQAAADHCVLQGDDSTGRVRPGDNMNRAEMVVMLHRVDQGLVYGQDCGQDGFSEPAAVDVMPSSSTKVEVEFNVALDQTAATDVARYSVTGPTELPISSAAMINQTTVELTLSEAMQAGEEYTLVVTDMMAADGTVFSSSLVFDGYTAIVIGDGTLEISLSSNTPVGDTIPQGAIGVVMSSIDLTASVDDVIIENVTILHEGFGSETNLSGVYGVVNGERVTRKRTIDSQTTTATVRFQTPLVVRAGETVTLDIAGDLTTLLTASSEHSLTVELPSDIESNAREVTGNFPMRGNTFRVAAVTTGIMSVAYRSVTPAQIEVGDSNAKVGKFELSINSTEDQTIYSMTVENDGTSSDGDIINLRVRRSDGTVLTNSVAQTVADFATFVFDPPFTVLEGDKVSLDIVADVVGGAAKNVKVHFDEASDIFAVGSLYGYGVNGQLYGSQITLPTETSTLPATVSIDAGQFTMSISGPTTQDFTPDDDDAVLANVMMETGGEDIDIEELYIAIQGTTSTGAAFKTRSGTPTTGDDINEALEDVELRNTTTGRTVNGVRLTASGTSSTAATTGNGTGAYQIYRFDDFVVKGKETYVLRVDFIDNSGTSALSAPANGDRFRIHICGEPTHVLDSTNALIANTTGCTFGGLIASSTSYQMKVKGASTNDRVGDVRPRGVITGNFQDIKTSDLVVTHKNTVSTDTTVKNAKDVSVMRFEVRASEAKDILVTDFIFESANSYSLQNGNNFTLWVDSNGDGNVDTILQSGVSQQSSAATFDNLAGGGWVVSKDGTTVFEVHADIAASLTGTNPVLKVAFDTGATFIQAEEVDDGSSLSGIQYTNPGATTAVIASGCTANSTCQIKVTTADSTAYSIRSSGDLFVTKSTNPVRDRQLLGGTLGDEILRLQFHAEFEDVDVTDIVLTASGASTHASKLKNNIERFDIYKAGATTPFASARIGGCETGVASNSMCANMENQEFVVAKGTDIDVLIRPVVKSDQDGSVRNYSGAIFLDKTPTSSSGTGSVRARGLLSSNDLAANDGDTTKEGEVFIGTATATTNTAIRSGLNRIVHAKVSSITNANPDANGTAVPTGDDKPIGQFKFTAAPNTNSLNGTNDWVLSGVIFNVNATNVLFGPGSQSGLTTSDFMFYNKSNANTKATCTAQSAAGTSATAASGSLVVICRDLQTASTGDVNGIVQTAIDAGTDATFVLEADILNSAIAATTSTLQVSLTSFTTNTFTAMNHGSGLSHIIWVDDDSGSSDTAFFWLEYPETSVNSTSYTK